MIRFEHREKRTHRLPVIATAALAAWFTASCSSSETSGGSPSGGSSAGDQGTSGTGSGGQTTGGVGRTTGGSGTTGSASSGSGGSAGTSSGVTGAGASSGGTSGASSSNGSATSGTSGISGGTGGTSGSTGNGRDAGTGAGDGNTANTGGSATGGVGGNGSDGGGANSAMPTKSGNIYHFAFGSVVFEVDAGTGGRVSKLSLSGADLIMTTATDPTTWGSVFWTSPRSDWTPMTWPPPAAIDNAAYTGNISGSHVVLNGSTDSSIGVSMSKDYSVDPATGWISIAYTVNAAKAIKAAPWEVTRVPRGGIVFFPAGSSVTRGPLTITQSGGMVWFDDAAKSATSPDGDKLAADGANGWTAYVIGGNLFLKKFTDQPASAQAPGEGEVDVYPGAGFLEFEVQGPYTQIAASGKLPWSMSWRVVSVPSSVTVAVGSTSLVDFAKQQLGL